MSINELIDIFLALKSIMSDTEARKLFVKLLHNLKKVIL